MFAARVRSIDSTEVNRLVEYDATPRGFFVDHHASAELYVAPRRSQVSAALPTIFSSAIRKTGAATSGLSDDTRRVSATRLLRESHHQSTHHQPAFAAAEKQSQLASNKTISFPHPHVENDSNSRRAADEKDQRSEVLQRISSIEARMRALKLHNAGELEAASQHGLRADSPILSSRPTAPVPEPPAARKAEPRATAADTHGSTRLDASSMHQVELRASSPNRVSNEQVAESSVAYSFHASSPAASRFRSFPETRTMHREESRASEHLSEVAAEHQYIARPPPSRYRGIEPSHSFATERTEYSTVASGMHHVTQPDSELRPMSPTRQAALKAGHRAERIELMTEEGTIRDRLEDDEDAAFTKLVASWTRERDGINDAILAEEDSRMQALQCQLMAHDKLFTRGETHRSQLEKTLLSADRHRSSQQQPSFQYDSFLESATDRLGRRMEISRPVTADPRYRDESNRSVRFIMTAEQEEAAQATQSHMEELVARTRRRKYKKELMQRLLGQPSDA
jgi:hypothetical protein